MIRKLVKFFRMDTADRINALNRYYIAWKTRFYYRFLLKKSGIGMVIKKPLYWNPNYIEIGDFCHIGSGCRLEAVRGWREVQYTPLLIIGNHVSMEQHCHLTFADSMVIGTGTTISFGAMITDIDHEYQTLNTSVVSQPLCVRQTIIGENCFIGAGAKIQAGTKLGRQCIIGTNAVVRGEFPDYCVIVGIPAKIVKRYNHETCQWQKTDQTGEFIDND